MNNTKEEEKQYIASYTWFKTGGPVKAIFKPTSIALLQDFLKKNKDPYLVIGAGSNIMVSDKGFDGTLILTNRLRKIEYKEDNLIYAEAGVLDLNLANYAANINLTGLEFLTTIPGTVGGAIRMNAGCNGSSVMDCLIEAICLTEKGELITLKNVECGFAYRHSTIPKKWIIVGGVFKGQAGPGVQKIKDLMEEMFVIRGKKQPIGIPSVGSVFKNPLPHSAWELIDKAGLRGYRHGTVMVSQLHSNFIVHNDLNSEEETIKSSDFLELVEIIKKAVWQMHQIQLETEVVIIK